MNMHTDAKMPHFKGKKEMGHFGIGMHIHASGLSVTQPFWGILATRVYDLASERTLKRDPLYELFLGRQKRQVKK